MAGKIKLPVDVPESEREEFENIITMAEAARKRVAAEAVSKGKGTK